MSKAYYNEFDSGAAAWLRELIRMGAIADGDVDERSIEDVYPSDLRGYTQCHFFAGIGGWSLALRMAGWGDDRPVWTGSCPCQPFSSAGQGKGLADSRHLWPVWMELIATCSPRIIIGEQVASKGVVGYANEGLYGVRGGQTPRSVSEIFRQREARIEAAMQGVPEGVRKDLALQFGGGAKSLKSQKKPESRDLFEGIQSQEPGGLLDCGVQTKEPEEGICVRLGCVCPSDARAHIQSNLRGIRDCSCVGGCAREGLQHPLARQDRPEQRVCLRECSDRRLCGECDVGRLGGGGGDVNHQSVATKQGVKNDESRVSGAADAQDDGATGGAWLDLVFSDLEGSGYACAAIAFPSSSVGAPHIRDRLYWLADSNQEQRGRRADCEGLQPNGASVKWNESDRVLESNSATHGVEYATGNGREQRGTESGRGSVTAGCPPSGLADDQLQQRPHGEPEVGFKHDEGRRVEGTATITGLCGDSVPGPVNGRWSDADWLFCRDGKWRPVEPGTFALVDGLPKGVVPGSRIGMEIDANKTAEARVMRLRGYGNAINPVQASMFVEVFMESIK